MPEPNGSPITLGTDFNVPRFPVPPGERLRLRVAEAFEAIDHCFSDGLIESGLILAFSAIEAMAWLYRVPEHQDASGDDFIRWVKDCLLPGSSLVCTAADLYGARCGMIHSWTAESRRNRERQARRIFYFRQAIGEQCGIIQLHLNDPLPSLRLDADAFLVDVKNACQTFLERIASAETLADLVFRRVDESFFMECTIKSGA